LVGAKTADLSLNIKIKNTAINALNNELGIELERDFITLHPWTSDPFKQWPIERFVSLTQRLTGELNQKVIIIGGNLELNKSKEYFAGLDSHVINLTGRTTLIQLAALLKKSKMLISGDSGPSHLASAVGTPVLTIFRSDIPAKSAKRWGPWGKGHSVIEKKSLSDITVDEVLDKVKEGFSR